MKRFLFYYVFACFCGFLPSQELNHITIENLVAGGLKDSLNIEQQKNVQSLTLAGSMNADDFYFIRDHLMVLRELDMKEVKTDTIPEKAFCNKKWKDDGFSKVVLPKSLKHLANESFSGALNYHCIIYITGVFPSMGSFVFAKELPDIHYSNYILLPVEDNPYCKISNGGIYSTDGKVIYYGIRPYNILQGTKEIAPRAFYGKVIDNVYIPASVQKIGDEAFANIEHPDFPMNGIQGKYIPPSIACYCTQLPQLGENVFNHTESKHWNFDLYVSDESVEKYKSTSQWNEFENIYSLSQFEPYLLGIKNAKEKSFSIQYYSDRLEVESSQLINKIELLNMNGQIIYQKKISDTKGNVFFKDLESPAIGILKVTYVSGKEECVKIKLNKL